MAEKPAETPAPTETPAAAAKPATKLSPLAKVLQGIQDDIEEAKKHVEALGKLKSEVQSTIEYARQKKMSDHATLALVRTVLPETEDKRASKPDAGGGRGNKTDKAIIAEIKKLRKDGKTYKEIHEETGVSVMTVMKYAGGKKKAK